MVSAHGYDRLPNRRRLLIDQLADGSWTCEEDHDCLAALDLGKVETMLEEIGALTRSSRILELLGEVSGELEIG
jgi:hypothetical protein